MTLVYKTRYFILIIAILRFLIGCGSGAGAPSITYPSNLIANLNQNVTALTPSNTGGNIKSCLVNPALPSGLLLDPASCTISGAPTVASGLTNYVVSATNLAGVGIANLSITVISVAPLIFYPASSYVFSIGTALTGITATDAGGAIQTGGCSVSPALPAGLTLNVDTCAITGTPTAISAASSYVVTAINSQGMGSVTLAISVNNLPPVISYTGSPYTFSVNQAITPQTVTSSGGAIAAGGCSILPALPGGLTLNTNTCAISGTPTVVHASTGYTITATNAAGSGSANINLTVQNVAPVISYAANPFVFSIGSLINVSAVDGGGAVQAGGCSISPALPAGLLFNVNTCAITGTPLSVSAAANYTITATNGAGSAVSTITVTVNNSAPSIAYLGSPFTDVVGTLAATLSITNSGGAIQSGGCSISPALPVGLNLDSTTCAISGTPLAAAVSALTTYTVTATNAVGSSVTTLGLAINNAVPHISYAASPLSLSVTNIMTPITITNTGGSIVSCSIAPALPAGLSFDTTLCGVSGTPLASAVTALSGYTVTATNAVGSSTATLMLAVNNIVPNLVYSTNLISFTLNTLISTLTPTNSGGLVQTGGCTISPNLPLGLSLNTTTCVLSGIPVVLSALTTYTITATNSAGSQILTMQMSILP